MFRYVIGAVRQESPAVRLIGFHIILQLGCKLRTLDDQHQFRVHISASQVKIIGTNGTQLMVNQKGLAMVGKAAVVFQDFHTGPDEGFLMPWIIAGSKEIVPVFN